MLYWVLIFLIVAAIIGSLGMGMAGTSVGIAQILLFILLAFLAISLLTGVMRRVR